MKSYTFRVVLEEDPFEDGKMAYHVYVPALEEYACYSWGYTKEEAMKNIEEVTRLVIESMLAHGESIPEGPLDQVKVAHH